MKNTWLKILPVPISGTMLGIASLGNLLQSFGEIYHVICSIIATALMCLLLLKLALYPAEIRKSMADPVQSAVAGTFPLVISAIAAKKTLMAGIGLGHAMTGMNALVIAETLIAVLIVAIVLGGYLRFLFKR